MKLPDSYIRKCGKEFNQGQASLEERGGQLSEQTLSAMSAFYPKDPWHCWALQIGAKFTKDSSQFGVFHCLQIQRRTRDNVAY